ncbi:MAG: hypothetical protein CFE39_11960 [Comamonadaceae bacterium PBBC2]|nr:MAG: hypothetical protein CFE39_11960 [Comamonadaceae bacterium PBBC2]
MKNVFLIEEVKLKFSLSTDADLAYVLGEKPYIVSGWKTERRPIPVGVKLRLLDHIKFSPDIKKLAAVFVESKEYEVQLLQDLDRLEELKRLQAGMPVNFADHKWIERVSSLQAKHGLTDSQTAQYLEMKASDLTEFKTGQRELRLDQKVLLLGLLAVKSIVPEDKLKRKLNKRIEKS